MSAGVGISRTDLTAAELRRAAAKCQDAKASGRMLAIALVLEDADHRTAGKICGMHRQTLRDWVHHYNAERLAGLVNRTVPPRPCLLAPDQMSEPAASVEASPDPARRGALAAPRLATPDLGHLWSIAA